MRPGGHSSFEGLPARRFRGPMQRMLESSLNRGMATRNAECERWAKAPPGARCSRAWIRAIYRVAGFLLARARVDRALVVQHGRGAEEERTVNRRHYGEVHAYNSITLEAYAVLLAARADPVRGDLERAERTQREAVAIARRVFGDEHLSVALRTTRLAAIVQQAGDMERALTLHREGVGLMTRLVAADDAGLASARVGLASCLTALGRYAEAEPLLLASYRTLESARGPDDQATRAAVVALSALYEAWDRRAEADRYRALARDFDGSAP